MNFIWITLPCKNIKETLYFYKTILGQEVQRQVVNDYMEMYMLGREGHPLIEIIYQKGNEAKTFHSDITVGIEVPSMDFARDLCKKHNIEIVRGPFSPNPFIEFLYIKDPEGYELQLVARAVNS